MAAAMLPREAQAAGHKVMIVGGSAIRGALGKYIETALAEVGNMTQRHAKSSTGLARPDFYNWPKAAAAYQQDFQPDATVLMFGGNDAQGLWMGKDADPSWIRWPEDGWSEEYAKRVVAFADVIAPAGQHVFWMGMPEMRSPKFHGRMERMNAIFQAQMQTRPNGHYLPTRGLMPGANGRYVDKAKVGGKLVTVRAADGIHFSVAGARIVADSIAPQIAAALAG